MAQKKRDEFTSAQKKVILSRTFKGKQSIKDPAGRTVTRKTAEIDHIVPAAKGGRATYNNAQVLHKKTNVEKSDKLRGTIGPKSNQKSFSVNRKTKTMNTKKKR